MSLQRVLSGTLARAFRGVYLARSGEAALRQKLAAITGTPLPQHERELADRADLLAGRTARERPGRGPSRNILFITTDQQRYDSLGVSGGKVARTPVLDGLARSGIHYRRAHVHNVVCMPSRSTMLTGQHPRTHGVIANGIALPEDAPSIARHLRRAAGYRTALIGKAHFEPHLDPTLQFFENRASAEGSCGPWRGFEHIELATHGPMGGHHYASWLWRHHPEHVRGFGGVLTGAGGGDTFAPEVAHNPIPREHYHTDWIAGRTIAWLASLPPGEPWFCWMSFPDPHHPFDPPLDEVRARIDWRDVPLPAGYPASREQAEAILSEKPRHWLDWYQGRFRNPEGGPVGFIPGQLTADQVREMNAMIHVENELIDEACGRVLAWLRDRGLDTHTDVLFTSDHGELQGDFGLIFKGPYHVEALLHIPLVWRPAPSAGIAPAEVHEPVGHVDLAPTCCAIAGVELPDWMQGTALPTAPGSGRQRVITTFDSQFAAVGMHLRTLYRDGYICTAYEPRTRDQGGRFPAYWSIWGRGTEVPDYRGTEGELYDCREDPLQRHNLWNDPSRRRLRDDLVADLYEHLPRARDPALPVDAPT
jgi:arylsulfatase A-like enzyme